MRRGCRELFSPPPRVSDPDMHHGTCVTHVPWCMPGSLTSSFLLNQWRGKRSRHSRRMRNPQLYLSGKRPIDRDTLERDISFGNQRWLIVRYMCNLWSILLRMHMPPVTYYWDVLIFFITPLHNCFEIQVNCIIIVKHETKNVGIFWTTCS